MKFDWKAAVYGFIGFIIVLAIGVSFVLLDIVLENILGRSGALFATFGLMAVLGSIFIGFLCAEDTSDSLENKK